MKINNQTVSLQVSQKKARQIMKYYASGVEDKDFQKGLGNWWPKKGEDIREEHFCWLYAWAARRERKASDAARQVLYEIFGMDFGSIPQNFINEARKKRYQNNDSPIIF